jgi:hypothetical protein
VSCGAAFGWAFASPPALPRTRLAPGPPGPDSPALIACLPCGAAFGWALASPPALPQVCLAADPWDLPANLVACSCPPALPSVRLAPRLRPCLELVSGSRLLQHFRPEPATSCRLSILRLPSCPGWASALRLLPSVAFGLTLSPVLTTAPAGFALRLSFYSGLAPFVSAQPCCRHPAPALDAGHQPLVSCHSFRPAFWPASLRRIGSRRFGFVLKRPSGMPLDPSSQPACACCFAWPSVRFPGLASLSPNLRHRPLACASADWFGPCGLHLLRLPTPPGLWTTGLSIPPACALGIRPLACSCLRPAYASRRSGAGLPVLPRRPRCR